MENTNKFELVHVELSEEYRKKWNVNHSLNDFCHLYKNGEKISDTLYRVGGFGVKLQEDYFMLLKQVESFYKNDITTKENDKRHLGNCACIIRSDGAEIKTFDQFDYVYLHGGVIYSLDNNYYNIDNGYCYSKKSNSVVTSENYIFIEDRYNKDKAKRGVIQISKEDGSYNLIQ